MLKVEYILFQNMPKSQYKTQQHTKHRLLASLAFGCGSSTSSGPGASGGGGAIFINKAIILFDCFFLLDFRIWKQRAVRHPIDPCNRSAFGSFAASLFSRGKPLVFLRWGISFLAPPLLLSPLLSFLLLALFHHPIRSALHLEFLRILGLVTPRHLPFHTPRKGPLSLTFFRITLLFTVKYSNSIHIMLNTLSP